MTNIPKEDHEGMELAKWLKENKYKFSHIANESGQRGTKNIIIMMAKKKALGVSSGFPDYCVVLKRRSLLFIELKRQRRRLKNGQLGASPSNISPEQIEWVDILSKIDNVDACICYGMEDAVEKIIESENL